MSMAHTFEEVFLNVCAMYSTETAHTLDIENQIDLPASHAL